MGANFSMFYKEKLIGRAFPVPLLALEYYAVLTSNTELADEDILHALHDVLVRVCKVPAPEDDDFAYLVGRLGELVESKRVEEPIQISGKSFGTSFAAYLNEMSHSDMLGAMTNYNVDLMRRLYCEVDFRDVKGLMESYAKGLMERNVVAYEAALYGAGNSYKGDSGGSSGQPIDANSKEGLAMMSQFGVGDVSAAHLELLGIDLVTK